PPNALDEPKPASSIKITSTLGASLGGRSGSIFGNFVSGSRASNVVRFTGVISGIGRTVRFSLSFELVIVTCPLDADRQCGCTPLVARHFCGHRFFNVIVFVSVLSYVKNDLDNLAASEFELRFVFTANRIAAVVANGEALAAKC